MTLYPRDVLTLSLSEVVGKSADLSELSVGFDSSKVSVDTPVPLPLLPISSTPDFSKSDFANVMNMESKNDQMFFGYQDTRGFSYVILFNSARVDMRYRFLGTETRISSSGYKCQTISSDGPSTVNFICVMQGVNRLELCTKDLSDQSLTSCFSLTGSHSIDHNAFSREDPVFEVFEGCGTKVKIIYFRNSNNPQLKDKFWMIHSENQKVVDLSRHAFTIERIKVSLCSAESNSLTLLISGKKKATNLYSIKMINKVMDHTTIRLIKEDITDYLHCGNFLLVVSLSRNTLTLFVSRLDGATKVITVGNVISVYPGRISPKYAIIPFYDTGLELGYLALDLITDVHVKIKGDKSMIGPIYDLTTFNGRAYLVVFDAVGKRFKGTELKSLQNIYITSHLFAEFETEVSIRILNQEIMRFIINFQTFDRFTLATKQEVLLPNSRQKCPVAVDARGNNLSSPDPRFQLVSPVGLDDVQELIDICLPHNSAQVNDGLFLFCDDSDILFLQNLTVKEGQAAVDSFTVYQSKSFKPHFSKIKSLAVFAQKFIVLLFDNLIVGSISVAKMAEQKGFMIQWFEYISQRHSDCDLSSVGLVCRSNNEFVFYAFDEKKETQSIQLSAQFLHYSNVIAKNIVVSPFDRSQVSFLAKDTLTGHFQFLTTTKDEFPGLIDQFPFSNMNDFVMRQVTQSCFVFISSFQHSPQMFVVLEKSALVMPLGQLQGFNRLIEVSTIEDYVFAVCYSSNDETVRGAVFRATFDAQRRLLGDFLVDKNSCDKLDFKLIKTPGKGKQIVYICAQRGFKKTRVWDVNSAGVVTLDSARTDSDSLLINNRPVIFSWSYPIYNPGQKKFELNPAVKPAEFLARFKQLEPGLVQLTGDVKRVTAASSKQIRPIHRFDVYEKELISDQLMTPEASKITLSGAGDSPIVSYSDVIHYEKTKIKTEYSQCDQVKTVFSSRDETAYFVCRSASTGQFIFTDNASQSVELDESSVENEFAPGEVLMVETDNTNILLFNYRRTHVFKLITVSSIRLERLKVINSKTFSLEEFCTGGNQVSSYFMTYDAQLNRLSLFFAIKGLDALLIKTADADDSEFESTSVLSLASTAGKAFEESAFFASKFWLTSDKELQLAVSGRVYIYIFKVEEEVKNHKSVSLVRYLMNPDGNDTAEADIAFSTDFLFFLNKRTPTESNIMIWNIQESQPSLFYAIGQAELNLSDYFIKSIEAGMNKQDETRLYVFVLKDKVEARAFSSLSMMVFKMDKLKIRLDSGFENERSMLLKAEFMDGTSQSLTVPLKEGFFSWKYSVLIVVLASMCLVLFVVGLIALLMSSKRRRDDPANQNFVQAN